MQVQIKIDSSCREPKILILTDKMTDEINELLKKLSEEAPPIIAGFKDDSLEILEEADVIRVYAMDRKVFAQTQRGEFAIRLRLYELEERLDRKSFVRISNSEIINIKKVRSFDLSLAGTICVSLSNGTVTYVSRRYVQKIKQLLGV